MAQEMAILVIEIQVSMGELSRSVAFHGHSAVYQNCTRPEAVVRGEACLYQIFAGVFSLLLTILGVY